MQIQEVLDTLRAEMILARTPSGRLLTESGTGSIDACMSDNKNYQSDAVLCANCGFVGSILLVPEGCPNCKGLDMTTSIEEKNIWNRK
jgi:hypothetical protein